MQVDRIPQLDGSETYSSSTVSPGVSIIANLSELLQGNATATSSAAPWCTFAGSVGSLVEFLTLSLKPVM